MLNYGFLMYMYDCLHCINNKITHLVSRIITTYQKSKHGSVCLSIRQCNAKPRFQFTQECCGTEEEDKREAASFIIKSKRAKQNGM